MATFPKLRLHQAVTDEVTAQLQALVQRAVDQWQADLGDMQLHLQEARINVHAGRVRVDRVVLIADHALPASSLREGAASPFDDRNDPKHYRRAITAVLDEVEGPASPREIKARLKADHAIDLDVNRIYRLLAELAAHGHVVHLAQRRAYASIGWHEEDAPVT